MTGCAYLRSDQKRVDVFLMQIIVRSAEINGVLKFDENVMESGNESQWQ